MPRTGETITRSQRLGEQVLVRSRNNHRVGGVVDVALVVVVVVVLFCPEAVEFWLAPVACDDAVLATSPAAAAAIARLRIIMC